MFSNILKWTFKVAVGEIEKEYNIHLDGDSPIEGVEQVALQMISHCSKVKEANAAAVEAQKAAQAVQPVDEPVESKVEEMPTPEGNAHV